MFILNCTKLHLKNFTKYFQKV